MTVDKNNVEFMKKYLKYALEFEKYVYIWTKSMDEVNARKRQIYSEKNQLESLITTTSDKLYTYDDRTNQLKSADQKQLAMYKKKNKNIVKFIFIFSIILYVIGTLMGLYSKSQGDTSLFSTPLVTGFIVAFYGNFCTFITPIALWCYSSNRKKAKALSKKNKQNYSDDSNRRGKLILSERVKDAHQDLTVINREVVVIENQQNQIFSELNKAKKSLADIYSINILPQKYRNLNAVASLYEYLETERCNVISGHGGIYDTYEVERIRLLQLQQMVQMNQRLANIEDYQRCICKEMSKANETLTSIKYSMNNIEKTSQEIAKNTAISAVANKQTAEATSYLAWRAWANGY